MSGARALRVDGLSVWRGRRHVVRDVTLPPLVPGSVTAVIGPNGAGKSSLLQAVAGLLPRHGAVLLDGAPLPAAGPRGKLAYLPEIPLAPASLTVAETIRAAARGAQHPNTDIASVAAVLEMFGIGPLGLVSLANLSAGQRQLVGLAQTFARAAPVLLLDEPTSTLDLRHQLIALDRIRRETRRLGLVTVMAMHDMALAARYADNVAALVHGKLAGFGAPGEVLTRDILRSVFGVEGVVETTSAGRLIVSVEHAIELPPSTPLA